MKPGELKKVCLSMPGAREEFPFDEGTSVFKVSGKMFALTALKSRPLKISLKCDPDVAVQLRLRYGDVTGGWHLNKKHWNTVVVGGEVPDELLREMVEDSYDLVVARLPRREQEKLNWVALARER